MTRAHRRGTRQNRSREIDRRDITEIAADVAAAVDLAEGAWGVVDVVRAVARHEPIAVREVSRRVELPVPVVAAVCNELRQRGVVDTKRPVRLTESGRGAMAADAWLDSGCCEACDGRGVVIPDELATAAEALTRFTEEMPGARMELDQAHCTVETKLRRVMYMSETGMLAKRTLFLGDDDLTSLAVALVAQLAQLTVAPMTVVDVDADLLNFIARQAATLGADIETVHHDAADPLPSGLRQEFEVALTDPPYTLAGAEVFLSRALSGLVPRPGQHLLFSFGGRRPAETVQLQATIARLGLAVRSLHPNFNEYLGAGTLAGTSHLYHLRTVEGAQPTIVDSHAPEMYTAGNRAGRVRGYLCAACKTVQDVGPGQRFAHIGELKDSGCPECGAATFRPQPLAQR